MKGIDKKMKIRITKCYLVEATDDKGYEIKSKLFFGKLADAKEEGKKLIKEIEAESNK